MKRNSGLGILLLVWVGTGLCGEARACSGCRIQDAELLSKHVTVSRFTGLSGHECLGRTALCPDRCGDSGTLATFEVLRYLHYEKPGESGDPQAGQFSVLVEDQHGRPKVSPLIRMAIRDLPEDETVLLTWHHVNLASGGHASSERLIERVMPVPEAGSSGWMSELDRLVRLRQPGWSGGRLGSKAWMVAVAEAIGVYDALGHGPDPGSDEWRDALHHKLFAVEDPAGDEAEDPQGI